MKNNKAAQIFFALTIAFILTSSFPANAKEKYVRTEPYNIGAVLALSLIPLNGPALIYTQHPVSGAIITFGEIAGFTMMGVGAAGLAGAWTHSCSGADDSGDCRSLSRLGATLLVSAGIVVWLPQYIYAAVKGPTSATKFNEGLKKQSFLRRLEPAFVVTDKKILGGMTFRF